MPPLPSNGIMQWKVLSTFICTSAKNKDHISLIIIISLINSTYVHPTTPPPPPTLSPCVEIEEFELRFSLYMAIPSVSN